MKRQFPLLALTLPILLACNLAYALVSEGSPTLLPPTEAPSRPTSTLPPHPGTAETLPPSVVTLSYRDAGPESCHPPEVWHPAEKLCFIEDPAALEEILPDYYTRIQSDLATYRAPSGGNLRTEVLLTSYQILGNEIRYPQDQPVGASFQPWQANRAAHQALWQLFAALIPPEARPQLREFHVFTDGPEEVLAYVEQTIEDPYTWALSVDVRDTTDFGDLTLTMLHEYGHLFSLNSAQVPPNLQVFENPNDSEIYARAAAQCQTYFTGEGCATAEAYIYHFFLRFWETHYSEWEEIQHIEDDDVYYDELDAFYQRYADEFISDYAATNPEEDFAESWAYFLVRPMPDGNTVVDEKLRFFYEYPALVRLRREIIARLYARMLRLDE